MSESPHRLTVRYLEGDRFVVDVRGHRVCVDQPISDGGADSAPTPTELFVAGLGSCVAFYARRYLARHHVSAAGLEVNVTYQIGGRPVRITCVDIAITPPAALPETRRNAFLAVASGCTVHNTLHEPPSILIWLADEDTSAPDAPDAISA
jgi:putative redox protein